MARAVYNYEDDVRFTSGSVVYQYTMPQATKDRLLAERLRKQADELELKAALAASFGSNEDYPIESAIFFKRSFTEGGTVYTYVAVKYGHNAWAVTGTSKTNVPWDVLVEAYLVPALSSTGEVWLVASYTRLPENG